MEKNETPNSISSNPYICDNPKVDLSDLLVYILLHRRPVLVLALIIGLLFGGFKGVTSGRQMRQAAAQAQSAEVQQAAETAGMDEQTAAYYDKFASATDNVSEYADQSILMKIDPNQESVSYTTIYAGLPAGTSNAETEAIAQACMDQLFGGDYLEDLAEQEGTEEKYLLELMTLTEPENRQSVNGTGGNGQNSGNAGSGISDEDGEAGPASQGTTAELFSITVKGPDQETTDRILTAMVEELEKGNDRAKVTSGYTIAEPVLYHKVVTDLSLNSSQRSTMQSIFDMRNSNASYLSSLTGTDVSDDEAEAAVPTTRDVLILALKSGLIAFLVALLVCCLVLFFRYSTSGKPATKRQVFRRYPVFDLGSFAYGSRSLYKHEKGLDASLRRSVEMLDLAKVDDVYDRIAANLTVFLKDSETFLLAGSADIESKQKLAEALQKRLPGKNFLTCGNLASDTDARLKLDQADCVILQEAFGKAAYKALDQEAALIHMADRKLAGLVLE